MTEPAGAGRLRVLLVSPGYAPTPGGVEEHVSRLAEQLARSGHLVSVLTARRGLRGRIDEVRAGVDVHVHPAWPVRALSVSPRLLLALRHHVRDADVVHVHSYHATTAFALFWPGVRGRAVFTPHFHGAGHSAVGRALHLVYRRLAPAVFAGARAVICVSRSELDSLLAAVPGLSAEQHVIPNGAAVGELTAAEHYADQPPTVLCLGRLEPYKGVDRVVRAVAALPAPTRLVIIGDGSQSEELRRLTAHLGLTDRVQQLGAVPSATVHRWLRTATVLASVSEHEAFGMAPIEAAAAGARVVLSDIPAYREIVADYLGDHATLVDGHDVGAIKDALAAALRESADGGPRRALPVPDWHAVAEATADVYRHSGDRLDSGTRRPPAFDSARGE